ncbi:MAG: acyl-CoA desaturase [Planctomycetota bacterium]|nr:acyl-CoA desaturase [Planctomycetota bacterium]
MALKVDAGAMRARVAGRADDLRPAGSAPEDERIRWWRLLPSLSIHAGCLGVIWVGWSAAAVGVAVALYFIRMFAITAFYHRYFSHRTFRTSRAVHTIAAAVGASSAQRGPMWWAAHHRAHHRESDNPEDIHSPKHKGIVWSHMGWFFSDGAVKTDAKAIPDLMKYPELRWIDRWHVVFPVGLAVMLWFVGEGLAAWRPGLGTSGWQMVVWGFFISTTALHHATFTINSLAHTIGRRRYETSDDSRNNLFLALLTLGEGWHNNHHFNPGSTRQGFMWWEIDPAYYGVLLLKRLGLVWDVRPAGERVYDRSRWIGGTKGAGEAQRES